MRFARRILILSALMLAACNSPEISVEVRDAWSPPAPPGATVIAVYATLVAHQNDTLLSVSSPTAREAQLHATTEENGMMKMRPVAQLALKAGETVRFEPGGMHLMLMDPNTAPSPHPPISLTFHFEHAGDIEVRAEVKQPN